MSPIRLTARCGCRSKPAEHMVVVYRKAIARDRDLVTCLSRQLYGGEPDDAGLEAENRQLLRKRSQVVFLALRDGAGVGFAHASIRTDYVEGTNGGPVGYLEGVFVTPAVRLRGIAARLVGLCEEWARLKGCRTFASDCLLDHHDSEQFHRKIGFKEANRIICWTKPL
ncbi:MAG: GNAT family N-acetyltransferase [Clostridiales bacterium]|nr:GNAT family N-acetyltransferase [Clostridiales bacterium]